MKKPRIAKIAKIAKKFKIGDVVICVDGALDQSYSVYPVVGQRYVIERFNSGDIILVTPEGGQWIHGVNQTGQNLSGATYSVDFKMHYFKRASDILTKEQREVIAKEWAEALDIEL